MASTWRITPGTCADFIDHVVPILTTRGAYQSEYASGTLRDKLFGHGDRLPDEHRGSRYLVGGPSSTIVDRPSTVPSSSSSAAPQLTASRSLEASSALFELGGTRSAPAGGNLSRYWRDARTHTLHDATRWKVQHIGRYALSGTRPPRHGQI